MEVMIVKKDGSQIFTKVDIASHERLAHDVWTQGEQAMVTGNPLLKIGKVVVDLEDFSHMEPVGETDWNPDEGIVDETVLDEVDKNVFVINISIDPMSVDKDSIQNLVNGIVSRMKKDQNIH